MVSPSLTPPGPEACYAPGMTKLQLIFGVFILTFMWSGVGYGMGVDSLSGAEPSNGDLFGFFITIVFSVAFTVAVWRAVNDR